MKNSKLLKGLAIGLMAIGFFVGLNAFIVLNGIPPCDGMGAIGSLTVDAASNFLQSNADVLLFLNEVEISEYNGFNFVRALELVVSAIEKLEKARADYAQMSTLSDSPCHGMVMSGKLQTFDYGRLVAEEQLNKEIMGLAAAYLVKGDVAGVYKKMLTDVDAILGMAVGSNGERMMSDDQILQASALAEFRPGVYKKMLADVDVILADLYAMRETLKKEVQPGLDSCWILLHRYSDAILFGNYVTLVFYHL